MPGKTLEVKEALPERFLPCGPALGHAAPGGVCMTARSCPGRPVRKDASTQSACPIVFSTNSAHSIPAKPEHIPIDRKYWILSSRRSKPSLADKC